MLFNLYKLFTRSQSQKQSKVSEDQKQQNQSEVEVTSNVNKDQKYQKQSEVEVTKKAKSQLQKISIDEYGQNNFIHTYRLIQQSINKKDIVDILLNYVKKKQATELAEDLYYGLEKDKKKLPKIQLFYQILRQRQISDSDRLIARSHIQNGKKHSLNAFLIKKFGDQGKKIFLQYESQFPFKEAQPLPGSKQLKKIVIQGLKIFQYPQIFITNFQKSNAKTLIILGQTGCGKSRFLNALTNYLAGVEFQDSFRYYSVVEEQNSQLKSITANVTTYYVKDIRTGQVYRIVDTPGFGDTEGVQKDNQNTNKIKKILKELDSIHLILFLMKSSNTRVTVFQFYIFQAIMDLFDKSIAQNFVFTLTFSDAWKSPALESIMDKQTGFGNYWNQIKQPKTIFVNNSGFFIAHNPQSQRNNIMSQFWRIGCQFLALLIRKTNNIRSKSLNITKQLLNKKQNLSIRIKAIAQSIQNHVAYQQDMHSEIVMMIKNQEEMQKNENFSETTLKTIWYTQKVDQNVTRCNNITCLNSNCHQSCAFGDGNQKKQCSAMQNQFCTVCPGKCHYANHANDHYLRKQRQYLIVTTKQDIKQKHDNAKDKSQWYEKSLNKMLDEYIKTIKQTKQSLKQMVKIQAQLQKISMSKSKPMSTKRYIQLIIQTQQREKKIGYSQRIQAYNRSLRQLQIQENILNGQTLKSEQQERLQMIKQFTRDAKNKDSRLLNHIVQKITSIN